MTVRIRTWHLLVGASLALTSAWAVAQDAPESLLPKMFDEPTPTPTPAPSRPAATGGSAASRPATTSVSTPVIQPLPTAVPSFTPDSFVTVDAAGKSTLKRMPTLEELQGMSPEDFEQLLTDKLNLDMPAGARRSMEDIGLVDESEGGMAAGSLATQNPYLVQTALAANRGTLVSRWGHILLRRALASRLQAPAGMSPQQFLALRVGLLIRMGENDAARAVMQGLDISNFTPDITREAFDIYQRTADFTGMCPVLSIQGVQGSGIEWSAAQSICDAFRGSGAAALSRLEKARVSGKMPRIDSLLAQKYAGAAGRSRKAVTIEWDGVDTMTPWRYGLAIGVGLNPPESAMVGAGPAYDSITALAPMVGLSRRAAAADRAGATGVLSNAAMVDLYAQLYADPDVTGDWQKRAETLRDAYGLESPAGRISAMQSLWTGAGGAQASYARQVLTAAAAARIAPSKDLAGDAGALIASMLAAGYDTNALAWSPIVPSGSQGWGLLTLAAPGRIRSVDTGAVDSYYGDDESQNKRKSAFLVAGLAGLGRIDEGAATRYSNEWGMQLDSATRFTTAIERAARDGDAASVAMLAGLGMQGSSWQRMTPRYLYHIVSALRTVGLDAEARMIAAEAVARA
ncbi:hypothetical protein [Novosphingobium sp.]|jgi:hypothetical protein|uniref:hypothetical protein n=1 Tax=Novosphingobium sp. TaxID=1874826 RepID=UPI002FE41300